MTVIISKPAINLRQELASLRNQGGKQRAVFETVGDTSSASFAIPTGFKPVAVYVDGSRQREGSGEAYLVTFDGFIYTVTFDSAPAAVNIDIDIEVSE